MQSALPASGAERSVDPLQILYFVEGALGRRPLIPVKEPSRGHARRSSAVDLTMAIWLSIVKASSTSKEARYVFCREDADVRL